MSQLATGLKTGDSALPRESLASPCGQRENYDGVSCRPMGVSPGPKSASRVLRLRCKLDMVLDSS